MIFCFIHLVMCFVSLLSYSVARSISWFCYFGLIRVLYFDSTRLLHLSKHGRAVSWTGGTCYGCSLYEEIGKIRSMLLYVKSV